MSHLSTRRRLWALLAIVAVSGAGLVGCSSKATASGCNTPPEGASSSSVRVSGTFAKSAKVTKIGTKPTSTFQRTVLKAGNGAPVKKSGSATIHFAVFNSKAKVVGSTDSSFAQGVSVDSEQVKTKLWNSIACTNTGSRLVLTGPMSDFLDLSSSGSSSSQKVIWVVDIEKSKTVSAAPTAAASSMPTVTEASNGVPSIGDLSGTAPTQTRVAVLKKGTGKKITSSSTVQVRYIGKQWANNTVFDTTWSDASVASPSPASFSLSQVITGFQKGLLGQRSGSRVLIEMSAADAYGAIGSDGATSSTSGAPLGALVFLVDIVGVSN
ncbi:MAG: FKBP-type peptidyl-prolyl cis-trans isomerase [Microbacteriaceae bacterium]|nr:FKBP-type peptidyl-prolyl cis-trans isomerase [Microbacteriaceae bacterium]MCI1207657.1 FKBP-type peptidyl-prolyl cis-trans isomerase [Microbacteriaceae bacterium]